MISPPFVQLNTPYPATAYLKGYLNTLNVDSFQVDLGLEVILRMFSKKGLDEIFDRARAQVSDDTSENALRILQLKGHYLQTIEPVIDFLQDKKQTLAQLICNRNFLPEASRFEAISDLEWAFGRMGLRDKARHLATLYIEDLGDMIAELVDPYFGFSRYAERIGSSASSFDDLAESLAEPTTYIMTLCQDILQEIVEREQPNMVVMTVPFPGNLFAALSCSAWLRAQFPNLNVALGGGYVNTELRQISDPRIFDFVDFICLDDGEAPLRHLLEYLEGKRPLEMLKRTFVRADQKILYHNGSLAPDVLQQDTGVPDYTDLKTFDYLSVIEIANPMHQLWSNGRWNKLTLAHGCYWGKCTFCDISLDYIANYQAATAPILVDKIEQMIAATGEHGFHFVDEAAPPALMRDVALEILRRKLTVVWWANIRFEKSFNADLCRLLAASGCIAVSGGLEVASDRLLKLIDKGITVGQVAKVTQHFTDSGIMVHAYLMYGFPTQTDQETIDSLEMVRQLFELGIVQSGYWHQFSMTAHSPIGINPEKFKVRSLQSEAGSFANNDLPHEDPTGAKHHQYSEGLRKSLYNYMHGLGFELPLQYWFDFPIKKTSIAPNHLQKNMAANIPSVLKPNSRLVWLGQLIENEDIVEDEAGHLFVLIRNKNAVIELGPLNEKEIQALNRFLEITHVGNEEIKRLQTYIEELDVMLGADFELLWYLRLQDILTAAGMLIL